MTHHGNVLGAVLCNPPYGTSGIRTLNRVKLAADILGFIDSQVANLFVLPSYRSNGLTQIGDSGAGWMAARPGLDLLLETSDAILLAYGVSAPVGAAKTFHSDQVRWLEEKINRRSLPVFGVGGQPRHPSRWQRYTHLNHPEMPFKSALSMCFAPMASGIDAS